MGWQDRHWAKLGDDELDALYGMGVRSRRFSVRRLVCTEFTQQPSGAMQCTIIDPNVNHLRVARAAPYDGPCAHLMAEQATARWVCVSSGG